jgi:branched-chain amino acid transport system substrate-binding protein
MPAWGLKRPQNGFRRLAAALAFGLATATPLAADMKIAAVGPMSGANAIFGTQLKTGVELAAEDINAAGGILGQKIAVVVGDDFADTGQGASLARRLVADGVKFVVGHFYTSATLRSDDVYQAAGILVISPSASDPRLTERGLTNVFRLASRSDRQGEIAGLYLAANFADRKLAILHDRSTYGKGLADKAKAAANAQGLTEVLFEGVNAGDKDYAAVVGRLKAAGTEIVYWGGLYPDAALLLRQMRDQGLASRLMAGDALSAGEFAASAGPAAEGTLFTFPLDPQKRPQAAGLVKRLASRNIRPDPYVFASYAAVEILKQAAEAAGSLEPGRVADVLHSGRSFATVLGDVAFDASGDSLRPEFVVYAWKKAADGKFSFGEN